LILPIILTKIS